MRVASYDNADECARVGKALRELTEHYDADRRRLPAMCGQYAACGSHLSLGQLIRTLDGVSGTLEMNVGSPSRQAPLFLFFYRRLGLRT
jgi:hypothetical protein